MAELPEISLPYDLNTKLSIWSVQKENIEKPEALWNKVLWTDKTKIELFSHHQKKVFWRKKGDTFVEKNNLPTIKHGGGSIMLWGCMAAGGDTGNMCAKEEWIPPNIKKF